MLTRETILYVLFHHVIFDHFISLTDFFSGSLKQEKKIMIVSVYSLQLDGANFSHDSLVQTPEKVWENSNFTKLCPNLSEALQIEPVLGNKADK